MRCSRVVLRIAVGHVAIRLVAVGPSSPVGILVHSITGLQAPVMQEPTFVPPLVKKRSTDQLLLLPMGS
jgi:hypothetical protein